MDRDKLREGLKGIRQVLKFVSLFSSVPWLPDVIRLLDALTGEDLQFANQPSDRVDELCDKLGL